jgi:SARP family transcriptional regulator, regulator of embCAB operon
VHTQCLRSALARRGEAAHAVEDRAGDVAPAGGVSVDFSDAQQTAHRLLDPSPRAAADAAAAAIAPASAELLPGWLEDWVLAEAERWRQLRLHALEAAAGVLAAAGRFDEAAAVVAADPLRESGRAALIRVDLAEGDQSEAVREFEHHRRVLHAELGLQPSERMRGHVRGHGRRRLRLRPGHDLHRGRRPRLEGGRQPYTYGVGTAGVVTERRPRRQHEALHARVLAPALLGRRRPPPTRG